MAKHGEMTAKLQFWLDPATRREIEKMAEAQGRTVSNAARWLLLTGLAAQSTQQSQQEKPA